MQQDDAPWARRTRDGWLLDVHVQPRARRTEVVGRHGERLKIRVAAPATGGKANAELVHHVAERLGVPARAVTVVRGMHSRIKTLAVVGAADPAPLAAPR